MPLRVNIRVTFQGQLPNAHKILANSVHRGLVALGEHLVKGARGRARDFSGQERRRIQAEVSGTGLNKFLEVFGTLWQHWVDELGLPPGTFPPWGLGTRIFNYVSRKGLSRLTHRERHNAGVKRRARRVSHVRSRRSKGAGYAGPHQSGPRGRGVRAAAARASHRRGAAEARATKTARAKAGDNSKRRVAFLVARAIFERGIRAGEPFKRTFEANRAKIVRDIENSVKRAVNTINRGGPNVPAD